MKELANTGIERQNILNNRTALQEIQKNLEIRGVEWKGEMVFTKVQVAQILDVDVRTVERYLSNHELELRENGYHVLQGRELREFIAAKGTDINVGTLTSIIGLFTFKTLLNLAMLLTESDVAQAIRKRVLDIVIDVIAQRTGGNTKYVNQRDKDYLFSAYSNQIYHKKFVEALTEYVENFPRKTNVYIDKVYKSVFEENAKEYKRILDLSEKDKERDTFYSEVLTLISGYENGLAAEMGKKYQELGRKLKAFELKELFEKTKENSFLQPFITEARVKMASRDQCFRGVNHPKLAMYIQAVPEGDFEKFLGEQSKALEERIKEEQDVFKRLKDR